MDYEVKLRPAIYNFDHRLKHCDFNRTPYKETLGRRIVIDMSHEWVEYAIQKSKVNLTFLKIHGSCKYCGQRNKRDNTGVSLTQSRAGADDDNRYMSQIAK